MRRVLTLGLGAALALVAGAALAQGQVSVETIQQAAQNDPSVNMLKKIFGDIAGNPFTAGTSVLGSGFAMLNAAALAIGVLWFTYTIMAGIVQTAHDGEFLGKRYSSVWLPIRFTAGIGSLVPVFGGYSLAQGIMLWAAMGGVGIANMIEKHLLTDQILNGKSMVVEPRAQSPRQAIDAVFRSAVCMYSVNQGLAASASGSKDKEVFAGDVIRTIYTHGGSAVSFGTVQPGRKPGAECGSASISQAANPVDRGTQAASVSETMRQAHIGAFQRSVDATIVEAENFVMETLAAEKSPTGVGQKSGKGVPGVPTGALAKIAANHEQRINDAVKNNWRQITQMSEGLLRKLGDKGWSYLGTFYQDYAVINERLAGAAAISIDVRPPSVPADASISTLGDWQMLAARLEDPGQKELTREGVQDERDSWSVGQWLVEKIVKGVNFAGGTEGSNIANPLIVAKNVGDSVMVTAQTVFLAYATGVVSSKTLDAVVGWIPGAGKIAAAAGKIFEALSWIFIMAFLTLAFAAIMLSVYLPMIPYIIWFGGLLAWLAVVAEAVIAAPLWAMMHLDGEGDGMGQRTGHGYLFLLNVTFRPALMVLGFFIGSVIMVVMGQFLNETFFIAMSSAQNDGNGGWLGNSMTGLISMIGFLFIYAGLMMTLVNSSFSLIHVVPDQVLGWLGGHMGATVGRETEQGTNKTVGAFGGTGNSATSGEIARARNPKNPLNGLVKPPVEIADGGPGVAGRKR